jgi:salicylate hydroxylase
MALEDAWDLFRRLDETPATATALAAYEAARRPRTARIVQAAEENATNYHLRPGPLRLAAHAALRVAARTAPHLVTRRYDWIHAHDVTRA